MHTYVPFDRHPFPRPTLQSRLSSICDEPPAFFCSTRCFFTYATCFYSLLCSSRLCHVMSCHVSLLFSSRSCHVMSCFLYDSYQRPSDVPEANVGFPLCYSYSYSHLPPLQLTSCYPHYSFRQFASPAVHVCYGHHTPLLPLPQLVDPPPHPPRHHAACAAALFQSPYSHSLIHPPFFSPDS